jgi:hypothetical protein
MSQNNTISFQVDSEAKKSLKLWCITNNHKDVTSFVRGLIFEKTQIDVKPRIWKSVKQ